MSKSDGTVSPRTPIRGNAAWSTYDSAAGSKGSDYEYESVNDADGDNSEFNCGEPIKLLEAEINGMRRMEAELSQQLDELDKIWTTRRDNLREQLQDVRVNLIKREEELLVMTEDVDIPPGPRSLSWVEGPIYTCICTLVIITNLLIMLLELKYKTAELWAADQFFLSWYCLEVVLKFTYHQNQYLIGKIQVVWWNWMDLGIVLSGIADQWVMPLVQANEDGETSSGSSLTFLRVFRLLRVFRIVRVLKIMKYFLQTDLSWVEGERFQSFIMGVIVVNTMTMGLELDVPWVGWFWIEHVLLAIYVFELAVRLKQHGTTFFVHRPDWIWNNLDFIIVLSAVAEQWVMPIYTMVKQAISHSSASNSAVHKIMKLLRVLRLLRILRVARLLRKVKPLYKLIEGIVQAMQGMQWVLVLTFVVLYAFAILVTAVVGHGLIGAADKNGHMTQVFGSVPESMFSLFKLMNADQDVMEPLMEAMPITRFFFVLFMVIANWMILATLTAVVSENMISVSKAQQEEEMVDAAKVNKRLTEYRLRILFDEADVDKSRTIDALEWRCLMQDKNLSAELCDATGLGHEDLEDLFAFLSAEDDTGLQRIQYENFIEQLRREGAHVSERSIFRLEKRIRLHEKKMVSHARIMESWFVEIMRILSSLSGLPTDQSKPPPRTRRQRSSFIDDDDCESVESI